MPIYLTKDNISELISVIAMDPFLYRLKESYSEQEIISEMRKRNADTACTSKYNSNLTKCNINLIRKNKCTYSNNSIVNLCKNITC